MPRASRYLLEGYTYHLTHRCHDRRFLLKFRQERDAYREWLRIGVQRYNVSVYAYCCITSNHVHIVVHVDDREAVARLMQLAAAVVAKALNRRKGHGDSVWEHPYHCTMIEDGTHLLRCLHYIDLNMVRAGAVAHPGKWRWCGYDELTGRRQRYRVLDVERLVRHLEVADCAALYQLYDRGMEEQLARRELERQAHWSESLAVGSRAFVSAAESLYRQRKEFTRYPICCTTDTDTWAVREDSSCCGIDSETKTDA